MDSFFLSYNYEPILQLIIALVLGSLIGIERSIAGKTAGMRTFALVSLGATLFVIIARILTSNYLGPNDADAILRVVASIVSGIGFIGAGLIIFGNQEVRGLTTAAGLWVSAAIGVAVGMGFYIISTVAVLLTLFTLRVLYSFEEKAKEFTHVKDNQIK
ncbi:magnesium transporter MgtC [Candidatus Campbellbacteria bacterium CG22_combo_CG10-13_8_21_14_all_36_13]|uniref:Magnesium transporter MgtC n=1 Tax=Candidatus Campbellbacteria bacterium CG22_combo_CG10-13_8_21_14_all_36_13 TaxID=1974529 RepID=A0A2H0DZX6_9BACT|nr:MAG: magnesium transporter MgtC [Candidatus Campbellbacteria bacterium CG22_combo_CG10-13_8_21_14_all_36_13]